MRRGVIIVALLFALAPSFAAARTLLLGSSGSDVVSLQQALIAKGYLAEGRATGYFGPLTEAAVKKFQCAEGIICSGASVSGYGVYGPRTTLALGGGGA